MPDLRPEPNPRRPDAGAMSEADALRQPLPGQSPTPRLLGLDALRGLAILLMCLSGLLPTYLPNAMYHGYYPSFLPRPGMTIDGQAVSDAQGNVPLTWQAVENPHLFRGVDWPSLTWVDWVFPGFLFAMGAAIPLAYARRLSKGESAWRLARSAVWRFVVLVGFAVYVKQMSPWHQASGPGASVGLAEYWTSIVGLLLLLPVLGRLPKATPSGLAWMIRGLGVASAAAFLAMVNDRATSPPFSWNPATGDADIIILLLAWSSVVASLLWLVTQRGGWLGWGVRLVAGLSLAFVAHDQAMRSDWRLFGEALNPVGEALRLPSAWLDLRGLFGEAGVLPGHLPDGLLNLGVLYDFTWLKFLWVVVPGTVIGDVLVRYLEERRQLPGPARPVSKGIAQSRVAAKVSAAADGESVWGLGRHVVVTVSLMLCVVAVFVGLKDYAGTFARLGQIELATPYAAVLLALPPLVVALLAMQGKPGCHGRAVRRLTLWGTAWLTAGLVLAVLPDPRVVAAADAEPWARFGAGFFEGGIGKGPPARLSWYLTALGVSILLLVVLMLWIDVRGWAWPWGWLTANGQNPMLAYAMLSGPLAALVGLPWLMLWVGEGVPANLDGLVALGIERLHGPDASPWHDAGWDLVKTLALAGVVWLATRRGVVLRS